MPPSPRFPPTTSGSPTGASPLKGDQKEKVHDVFHKLARPHPVTGRKALYVNQLMTMRIEGLAEDESREILKELWALNAHPDIVYSHPWRMGDLVMWDNLCSTHARTDFPPDQTRLMRRCTVAGDPLIAG